ncbi:MAG: RlmE family RNA methyltransferase [Nitrososphaerales archaeon]
MKLDEAKRDYYRRRAKEEGYRSRAAFKLIQLNEKYRLFRANSAVVDIGAAPGGWLEVASQIIGERGLAVGVDLVMIDPVGKNVKTMQEDITSSTFPERLQVALGKSRADCVLADLSPKLSGIWDMDHFKQIELCQKVVDILPETLAMGGSCVMKAFHGAELDALIQRLRKSFERLEVAKPDASRKESSEVYLVATGFKGLVPERQSESPSEAHLSEPPVDLDESVQLDDRLPEA